VKFLRLWWTDASDPVHCHIARDVRVTEMYRVEGQSTTAHNVNRRARRHGLAVEITVVLCANGRSRLNVGNMSSNVVLFRHSSQDAMSLSRRHDQRHVAGTTHHVCKWRLGKTWQIKTFPAKHTTPVEQRQMEYTEGLPDVGETFVINTLYSNQLPPVMKNQIIHRTHNTRN
jgi:hypothetical protein